MTTDPAMLIWLSLSGSTKQAPNENYAREMQELFALGVGDGYTEQDVREHARALTGWTNNWNQATGEPDDFHFDPTLHDDGVKLIYHKRGRFGWRDSLRLVIDHPDHPRYFVTKLWSYFSPAPLPRADLRAAQQLYLGTKQADPAAGRGVPDAPAHLHGAAHRQAADRADRRDAPRDRPLHRHGRVGVGVEPRRPDAVLPAERRRLGRDAVAEHRHVVSPLQPDLRDDRCPRTSSTRARRSSRPTRGG